MTPFLYKVAATFYKKYGVSISRMAFVFPNRRAGIFFQKYLGEIARKPIFSPTILTINDLFMKLSGKQTADKLSMLFTLYDIYKQYSNSDESFDEFQYWGEMLLGDFDDVDKYMANAKMLFTNVTDLKEIEQDFDFLSEEQIKAIRSFWSSFYPKGDSANQQEFLSVWKILYNLYSELRTRLSEEGKGYEGMIFREVVEELRKDEELSVRYDKIIFVGLNALSKSEEELLSQLQKREMADFYWDYESPMVCDAANKASYFALRNMKMFPSKLTLVDDDLQETMPDLFAPSKSEKEIRVIGIPSGIGQAKQLYSILDEMTKSGELTPDNALKTAVVLPDEHLLMPVLNAIPQQISRINVTMGYPLSDTPVASLMDYLLTLQQNLRIVGQQKMFYYQDVLPILNHRYIMMTAPDVIYHLISDIAKNNRIYISEDELSQTPLLKTLFTPVNEIDSFSDYLILILQELNKIMTEQSIEDEDAPQKSKDIEQEFIFHYFATVNRLKGLMYERNIEMKIDTYFRLLRRLTESITIPFHGEPLSGLQIMGVLETRALDFDRVIILSMNEGIFPLKKAANSFIPYNLRKGFGLPTYEHQDSVWAYHFYRLIYRATNVNLLYDTRSTGLLSGEVSRFIHQLHYHYEEPIEQSLTVYDVATFKTPSLERLKTDDVMSKLCEFKAGGRKALSASAINTYISCPLKFFFSYIENIREADEVNESIEQNVFGDIIHAVMEELYSPFCGKMVTADLLKLIEKNDKMQTEAIEKAFAEKFFKNDKVRHLSGQNFLIGEVIRKYIKKIIETDRATLTPFQYVASEKLVDKLIELEDSTADRIKLKGFIDRIDDVKDRIRIVDYKSGGGNTTFTTVADLFDGESKKRNEKVMQVFLYSWIYGYDKRGRGITPCIYFARELFTKFDPYIYQSSGGRSKEVVEDFEPFFDEFESELKNCLGTLFNPDISFYQTKNEDNCKYCLFKDICGR